MPYTISKQVDATNDFLAEETEKFLKAQIQDEQLMADKIEILTVQVSQMAAKRDFNAVCRQVSIRIKKSITSFTIIHINYNHLYKLQSFI